MRAHEPRMHAAAIALLAGAALLLVGFVSRGWFARNVGLLGVDGVSWFDVAGTPVALELFATAGILGVAGAIAFLVQAAVALLRHQPHRVMMVPLTASLGIAALGCTSLLCHLAFGQLALTVGYAGILTLAALGGVAIVVGGLVRPLARVST